MSSTIIQGVLTVAAGQQTSGVQVVERVGLVADLLPATLHHLAKKFRLQFFTRLAAVFAEEELI